MKNEKIKVLEVMHGLAHGGIESFVLSVIENIDSSRFQVDIALASDFPQFHEERVIANGNKIFRTKNLGSMKNNIIHFVRLVKLIRKEKYDVVHTHIDYFNGVNILAAWLGGASIRISHSHNTRSANASSEKESIVIKCYHFLMRTLINLFSTNKVGCSEAANEWMYLKTDKCQVIYNAINLSTFDPSLYNKDRLREKYGVSLKEKQFVTVGRIEVQKNPLYIAEVINEYAKIDKNFHFHWVSDGSLKEQVQTILMKEGNLDKVTFWGVRKDIPEILSVMDYFVFPSLWEGLGIVLVEAQAMGIKCFVSERIPNEANIGGMIKIDLDKGSEEWAKIIKAYVDNDESGFKVNEERLSKYNVKNMVREIERLYSLKHI